MTLTFFNNMTKVIIPEVLTRIKSELHEFQIRVKGE